MASGAARRYVQAIVELAQEQGTLDAWEHDLGLIAPLGEDPMIVEFLENPSVHEEDKIRLVDGAIEGVSPQARNLVNMLIDRHRIRLIPDIAELFEEEARRLRGIVLADVTTAEPLDGVGQEIVKRQLRQIASGEVELRLHTDPAIIGGIVARIGDQVIDGSVTNQLRRLRARLSAT